LLPLTPAERDAGSMGVAAATPVPPTSAAEDFAAAMGSLAALAADTNAGAVVSYAPVAKVLADVNALFAAFAILTQPTKDRRRTAVDLLVVPHLAWQGLWEEEASVVEAFEQALALSAHPDSTGGLQASLFAIYDARHPESNAGTVLRKFQALARLHVRMPSAMELLRQGLTTLLAADVPHDKKMAEAMGEYGDVSKSAEGKAAASSMAGMAETVSKMMEHALCACDRAVLDSKNNFEKAGEPRPVLNRPLGAFPCSTAMSHPTCRLYVQSQRVQFIKTWMDHCATDIGAISVTRSGQGTDRFSGGDACTAELVVKWKEYITFVGGRVVLEPGTEPIDMHAYDPTVAPIDEAASKCVSDGDRYPPGCDNAVAAGYGLRAVGCCKGSKLKGLAMFAGGMLAQFLRAEPFTRGTVQSDREVCLGCLFVVDKIKAELGLRPGQDDVVDAVRTQCYGEMPDIFYEACDDLLERATDLASLMTSGAYDTQGLCVKLEACSTVPPTLT